MMVSKCGDCQCDYTEPCRATSAFSARLFGEMPVGLSSRQHCAGVSELDRQRFPGSFVPGPQIQGSRDLDRRSRHDTVQGLSEGDPQTASSFGELAPGKHSSIRLHPPAHLLLWQPSTLHQDAHINPAQTESCRRLLAHIAYCGSFPPRRAMAPNPCSWPTRASSEKEDSSEFMG